MRLIPIYHLVIGESEIDSKKDIGASTVVRLDVASALDTHTDRFELSLTPSGGLQPAKGDQVKIELGFDDTYTRVFTGQITELIPEVTALRVIGLSTLTALEALHTDKTYEGNTAGQIVTDLAGQANVHTATIQDGIRFIVYVIDGRLSALRHIHRLAERCGFDAYVQPTGELVFRKFEKTSADYVFTYGQDILDYALDVRPERAAKVIVAGDSPASGAGDDAVSWLTKKFRTGQASGGQGTQTVLVQDPAIRTTEGANLRAAGVLRTLHQRALTGTLRALGRPEIKLGDALRIEKAPDTRLNHTFQVRAIRHRLSRRVGLITDIDFWDMP